jgi:hypothetical protein
MAIVTGSYKGRGATERIVASPLAQIRSFRVFRMPPAAGGTAVEGYTTSAIQAGAGAGTFINGGKRAGSTTAGITLETGGEIHVSHGDFTASGTSYFWEADGV